MRALASIMNEIEARNLVIPTIKGSTITKVEDFGELYCVYFVNDEYFKTGNLEDLKIGYGPSFVEKSTRNIFSTGSGQSAEYYVKAYKESGNIYARPSNSIILNGLENCSKNVGTLKIKSSLHVGLSQAKAIYETLENGTTFEFIFPSEHEAESAVCILKAAGILSKVLWK